MGKRLTCADSLAEGMRNPERRSVWALAAAGFLVGATATWLLLTWPAPFAAPSRFGVTIGLSIAGGSLGSMAAALSGLYRVTLRYCALLGVCAVIWLGSVRLLAVGSIGPFTMRRSTVWLALLLTAIVEAVLFNIDPPERRERKSQEP